MELTIKDLRSLLSDCSESGDDPFGVGTKWFLRTGTNYLTGEVTERRGAFIGLRSAAWIADTGRFADAMKGATSGAECFGEVEPWPADCIVWVQLSWIIDATPIDALPGEQK